MTVAGTRFDLSGLGVPDLQALRLGAQVMGHRAMLAQRPRVESYFARLQFNLETEMSQRNGAPDVSPIVSPIVSPSTLALGARDAGTEAGDPEGFALANRLALVEDRCLAAEYLDLLGANDGLSDGVRQAVRALRERLDDTTPGDA